jgi:DNA helicase-2/ATP-dependent DNA helicase PcrA
LHLLSTLNPVQREAVEAVDGPLLILAGAGSGKTRVLTHKVAYVVRALGVPAWNILAFTFTNKAAGEMRDRIAGLLEADTRGLWIGTFHATCVRVLRTHADAAGLPRTFSIFDRDDSVSVLKRVIDDRHLTETEFRARAILERISAAKSARQGPEHLLASAASRHAELVGEIYAEYEKRLRSLDALDFDDLLLRALELLESAPEVCEALASRFRHVFVDEYQDTNRVQFEITRLLASRHRNLTVVGDDDQSIYGWRGADIRNILDFEAHFPEARVLRLTQNYRSTQRILDAANAVVAHNSGRKEKALWTDRGEGENLLLLLAPDEEREAEEIVRTIQDFRRGQGLEWWDFVVLYRTNAQSRPFEEVCIRHRVPYRIIGSVQFFHRREVKDVLAYLRVAANPRDVVSFERAVGAPKRGVGKVSLARFFEGASAFGGDLVTAARRANELPGLLRGATEELMKLGALLCRIQESAGRPVDEVLELILRESGIGDQLADEGPEAAARRENVDELVSGARYFAAREEQAGFREYLQEVSLTADIDGWNAGENAVTLMTAHNAKGLEFEVVFVSGLEEGLFPHASALEDRAQLEEERRLLYVALTRAKRRCVLSASIERRRMNRLEGGKPSRFIREIPEGLIDRRDPWGLGLSSGRYSADSQVRRRAAFGGHRAAGGAGAYGRHGTDDGGEGPVIDLRSERRTRYLGRVVLHPKFGRGVVIGEDGEGDARKCEVRFANQLHKKFFARFLTLEEGGDD